MIHLNLRLQTGPWLFGCLLTSVLMVPTFLSASADDKPDAEPDVVSVNEPDDTELPADADISSQRESPTESDRPAESSKADRSDVPAESSGADGPDGSTELDTLEEPDASTPSESAATPSLRRAKDHVPLQKFDDIRSLTFRDVEAGTTRVDKVRESWGEPNDVVTDDGLSILVYDISPFKSVEIASSEEVVESIVIYLDKSLSAKELAKQLNLEEFSPVEIRDDAEEVLGLAYAERGVTFGFHPNAKGEMVAQILLESVSAEPFVLRAEHSVATEYQQSLNDLDYALHLNPNNAHARILKARLLVKLGRYESAMQNADRAVQLEPETINYRLVRARTLMALGKYDDARQDVSHVLNYNDLSRDIRAEALLESGNLVLFEEEPDFEKAMAYFQESITEATPLANDPRPGIRRDAKRVLIDTHIAIARAIVFGNWKSKKAVVPKWLDRAAAIAEDLIVHDDGEPLLRLAVNQQAVAVLAEMRREVNPSQIAKTTIERAEELSSGSKDVLYQQHVSWLLGMTMLDVLRIEHERGRAKSARTYGGKAVALLEDGAKQRDESLEKVRALGEAYFRLGLVYAILLEDHTAAIPWYDKSRKMIEGQLASSNVFTASEIGEWFVSMGVSYWETRSRTQAIDVTEHGVDLIQKAIVKSAETPDALHIPYSNLAHMFRQIGNDDKAKKYTRLSARQSVEDQNITRR